MYWTCWSGESTAAPPNAADLPGLGGSSGTRLCTLDDAPRPHRDPTKTRARAHGSYMSAQDSNGTYAARLAVGGGGGLAGGLAGAVGEGAGAGALDCLTSGPATITPFFTPCFSSAVFTLSSLWDEEEGGAGREVVLSIELVLSSALSLSWMWHTQSTAHAFKQIYWASLGS